MVDVGDNRVVRIVRVDLVDERPGDHLVGPRRPERSAAEGSLGVGDRQRRHPRLAVGCEPEESQASQNEPTGRRHTLMHRSSSPERFLSAG